jgi:hypothetical protein
MFPKHPPFYHIQQWKHQKEVLHFFFVGSNYPAEVMEEAEKLERKNTYHKSLLSSAFGELFDTIKSLSNVRIIFDSLYQDDTIQAILLKIMHFLGLTEEKRFPYVWTSEGPLRFRISKNTWKKYNIHPFLVPPKENPTVPEIQLYSDKIVPYTELFIATYEDVSKAVSKNALFYYFPNEKDIVRPNDIKTIMYEHQLLNKLWYTDPEVHKGMVKQSSCSYQRAIFKGSINDTIVVSYKKVFEDVHTSSLLPFIQFYDDMNHIYYKVYKKHRIPETLFQEWTNQETFANQHSMVFYSFLKEDSNSYMKLFMDQKKEVQVSYRLETSENIVYEKIHQHLEKVLQEIKKVTSLEITTNIERLALKTNILVRDLDLKSLSAYFATLPFIFHVPSKNRINKNILDMQFKRVAKYGESRNIVEFIKTKIELDVPLVDIIQELQEYGVDEMEVREYFEQIQRPQEIPMEKKKKRNFKNLGLLLHINPISLGLQIYIDNASSFEDIQNALFWIRSSVYGWQQSITTKKKGIVPLPVARESTPSPEAPEVVIPAASDIRSISSLSSTSSRLSLPSLGGAIGKQYQRLFKSTLEKLDPDIFARTENYARMCGVSDLRQPVGMTKEQKKKIDDMGYGDGYDNFMEYGSDPANPNIYMCPRIYCPDSQIPLSYEKFKTLGEKCPDPNETPIQLYSHSYWYNDPARKHYVGFLKERGYNNLQLPCCFKKAPKEERETKPKKSKIEKKSTKKETVLEIPEGPAPSVRPVVPSEKVMEEEGYIIDKLRPLHEGRYGTIPSSLHEFLYTGVPYSLCKNTVKSSECLLRRGVSQIEDSLLESIRYLLDFPSKESFLQHVTEVLDPFTYISLENGQVYTYFLPKKPILPEKNLERRKLLLAWLQKFPQYITIFQLEDILPLLSKEDIDQEPMYVRYKIARQLLIHASYENFVAYLKDREIKNPYVLFDFVYFLGALLLVWNRDSQNIATIRCPTTLKNKSWYNGQTGIPYIMVMQQDNYYEPLVIVDQQKNITQKISFTHFEKVASLLSTCPTMTLYEDKLVQDIYSLSLWIEKILLSKDFVYKRFVINPQDQAIGIFLENNLFIELPVPLSMFSIKNVIELCNIPYISYWEDIQYKTYDIRCPMQDLQLLQSKITRLGFGLRTGDNKHMKGDTLHNIYTVPGVIYKEPPKLPLLLKDAFIRFSDMLEHDNQRWYEVKKEVLGKLVKEYTTLVKPLLKAPKLLQLQMLHQAFAYLDESARTAVVLEETPYDRKELLEKLYEDLLLEKPYYHKDDVVYQGYHKKEWIFTQKAVQKELLQDVRKPTSIQRPKNEPKPEKEVIVNTILPEKVPYPDLLDKTKLETSVVPSKWRSQFWNQYMIGMYPSYKKSTLMDVFTWVSKIRGFTFDEIDLQYFLRKQVYLMLTDESTYETLLEDVSMRRAWNKELGRQYRTTKEIIDIGFAKKDISELQEVWLKVQKSPELWINDLDLYHMSKLIRVSFLVLQKGKDVANARGNLQELVAASKFISQLPKDGWLSNPMFVLYKQLSEDKKYNSYNPVISEKTNGYYSQGRELPSEMKKIIEQHLS